MTVDVDITPEPEPASDAPDVVVVDTGDSGSSGDVELGITLGTVMAKLDELQTRYDELAARTIVAETIADDAVDAVEDVADEVAEVVAEALAEEPEPEPVEPDNVPESVHWAHKSRSELFHKDAS